MLGRPRIVLVRARKTLGRPRSDFLHVYTLSQIWSSVDILIIV